MRRRSLLSIAHLSRCSQPDQLYSRTSALRVSRLDPLVPVEAFQLPAIVSPASTQACSRSGQRAVTRLLVACFHIGQRTVSRLLVNGDLPVYSRTLVSAQASLRTHNSMVRTIHQHVLARRRS